jgi:hypothetical protein
MVGTEAWRCDTHGHHHLPDQCLNSVQYGLLLFLVASGLTLIFGSWA